MDIDLPAQETGELCYSRNLLQRFAGTHRKLDDTADCCDFGIELGLGLSLGTCFAVDSKSNRIARSSSIAAFPTEIEFSGSGPLARARSLPGEEMKRKEMQGLKRMEFKRKRLEKRGGSRLPETAGVGRELVAGGGGRGLGGPQVLVSTNSSVPPSTPSAGHKSASRAPLPPTLRSLKSLQEEEDDDDVLKSNLNGSKHVGKNTMSDMPFVSTKGSGLNGRRIEGFLYKYKRGEEVRIVCICHGNFHTPAEFVKHGGGGDVPHPLRQIVVNPSPSVYY